MTAKERNIIQTHFNKFTDPHTEPAPEVTRAERRTA